MSYEKYKDLPPEETIAKYKNILKSLGSEPQETFIEMADGVWCGWLYDKKNGWSTNGKGTTKEYCMASAYGEAMERIQNMFFTSEWNQASGEAINHAGYEMYPDERFLPIEEAIDLNPHLYQDISTLFYISEGRYPLNKEELIAVWIKQLGGKECLCLPYYSVANKESVLMPSSILAPAVGTNGESSGNTPEEAITQGLSELFERYAEKMVVLQELTPPEISRAYLEKNYPDHYKTILSIESLAPGLSLRVFDFSLGIGLPVIGIILIDTILQRYRLQLGAHPLFTIALERCLTELLQGYKPGRPYHDELFMTEWSEKTAAASKSSLNNDSRFTNGIGSVPNSMFYCKPTWPFVPWKNQANFSNKKGMKELINLALQVAPDVYIRNNSILGVNSFSIYIPFVSISFYALGWKQLCQEDTHNFIRQLEPHSIWGLTTEDKEAMLFFYLNDPLQGCLLAKGIPQTVFIAALCCDLNMEAEAISFLRNTPYYDKEAQAAARDIELKIGGVSELDRDRMLEMFFGSGGLEAVKSIWRKAPFTVEHLYQNTKRAEEDEILYKEVTEDAILTEEEISNNVSSFLIKIKDFSKEHFIDQNDLKNILEG